MKRHVHAPQRTVTVEDGTVRDLDGNTLGEVEARRRSESAPRGWWYRPVGISEWSGPYERQSEILAALLADPFCPAGGPNLYDKKG